MVITYKKFSLKEFQKNIARSLQLLWQADKRLALLSFFLHVLQALLPVVSLYFIKILIEKVTGHHAFSEVVPIIIYFLLAQLLLAVAQQYANHITAIYQLKITDHLSQQVLNKAVDVSYQYYENPDYHDSLHLAQQQSLYRAGMLLTSFNSFITSGFGLIFLMLLFISMQSFFGLLFIAFSIPLAIIKWWFGIATMQQERKLAPLEREAGYLHQILTGVSYAKETRVFGFGSFFIDKFANIRLYIRQKKQQLNRRLTHYGLIAESIEIIAMAVIFAMLAKQSIEGTISLGLFVIYIQGFQSLQNNSKNFLQALVSILQQRIFLQDLFAFLDIETEKPLSQPLSTSPDLRPPSSPKGEGTQCKDFLGEEGDTKEAGLIVENLSFQYPQTDRYILRDISLKCKPGQIIAIVGENGSGKSTLIKILAKLYEANSGSVFFNHRELKNISDDAYQKQAVFLFQDFEKYFFTIDDNIILGEPDNDKTAEDIIMAAKLSGADSFVSKLPKGYQTRMGRIFEGSAQLSGGEWQKLALARVFYRTKASLIVLDEPTSALDAGAEFEIFKQIKTMAKDKMVILITHRLYNLKIADYLYVMQEGRIAEEGSFNELIEKESLFKQLYNMQQL